MKQETILLTFLGMGTYQRGHYTINGRKSAQVTYFSAALSSEFQPDLILSLQTEGAKAKHGDNLDQELKKLAPKAKHQAIPIPEGKTEGELWEIFKALTDNVPTDCLLHLDITHGFRSLPVLGFIALSYLRTTRNITIGGIHYGAWEAADPSPLRLPSNRPPENTSTEDTPPEIPTAPAFDLTPFLTLLDWTAAADQFLTSGSAKRLGDLLGATQSRLYRNATPEQRLELPKFLTSLGNSIKGASNDLNLLRLRNLETSATSVRRQIENTENDLRTHVPAFLEIIKSVQIDLTRFNNTDLDTLRNLVGWLVEKQRPDAALTLAAEWLVSWVMIQLGVPNHYTNEDERKSYNDTLNLWIDRYSGQNAIRNFSSESEKQLGELQEKLTPEELEILAKTAASIKEARNDLNHAGFRRSPKSSAALIADAEKAYENLLRLKLPCNSNPLTPNA